MDRASSPWRFVHDAQAGPPIAGESFVRSPITRIVHQSGRRSLPLDKTGQEAQPRSSLLRFFHVLGILRCNQRSPHAFEGARILPMFNENPRSCNPHNSIGRLGRTRGTGYHEQCHTSLRHAPGLRFPQQPPPPPQFLDFLYLQSRRRVQIRPECLLWTRISKYAVHIFLTGGKILFPNEREKRS